MISLFHPLLKKKVRCCPSPLPLFISYHLPFPPKIQSCTNPKLPMQTQTLLPISHSSSTPSLTSSSIFSNGVADTKEDQQQSHHLLFIPSSSSASSSSSFEDDNLTAKEPFLSKAFSSTKNKIRNHKRRRRVDSDPSFPSQPSQQSVVEEVEHAVSSTFYVTRLALQLLQYLGLGYRWIIKFLALGCYSILLMPGFLQVGYYYYYDSKIRRSIVYGDQPRNRLDLYIPENCDGPKPVVAFVTGGAWIIGYKAWGALLGLHLADSDVIVACIDYRNFPQATISDMVNDASQGISFVCNKIAEYGGDPNRIYIMGQSAGAHISACALIDQAIKESRGQSTSWSVTQIRSYFGLSGGYNLSDLVDHFHGRGMYRSIFLRIMEGEQSLQRFSPELVVQDASFTNAVPLLPPIVLFHGTADYSIPSDSSRNFADALRKVGAAAELVLYEGKTHTDVFVQDPLRGGTDDLVKDVVGFIYSSNPAELAKSSAVRPRRRLVPEFMLKLARIVSPF